MALGGKRRYLRSKPASTVSPVIAEAGFLVPLHRQRALRPDDRKGTFLLEKR
jgi:hypothetical protein